jgi:hypothetical protein
MIKFLKTLSAKIVTLLNFQRKIVKTLVESLKARVSLNDSSKIP